MDYKRPEEKADAIVKVGREYRKFLHKHKGKQQKYERITYLKKLGSKYGLNFVVLNRIFQPEKVLTNYL